MTPPALGAVLDATDELTVAPVDRRIASDSLYDEEIRMPDRDIVAGSGCGVCDCNGGPCSAPTL